MKQALDAEAVPSSKKRKVDYASYQKWQRDLDRGYKTVLWLDCFMEKESGKTLVVQLKCKVCSQFESKIRGRKNFSSKWIEGADSVRLSNVRDHAQCDQHTHAMHLLNKNSQSRMGLSQQPLILSMNYCLDCTICTRNPLKM